MMVVEVMCVTMGERIRMLREQHGLTMEALGNMLGIKKAAINKYENGSVENIKRSTIKEMARIFGVSPCFLMWGEEMEAAQLSADETALLESYRALNATGQSIALNTVKGLAGNPDLVKDTTSRSMAG